MKAIGNNIIIDKIKEAPVSKTDGGLLLTESQRQDVRYKKAKVVNCGDLVNGVKEGDVIIFPSYLMHGVSLQENVGERITLTTNIRVERADG